MNECNGVCCFCSILIIFLCFLSFFVVFQIVLTCLGILSAVVSLAYNIYVWYNKAMKDKKLSAKEAEELKNILDKGINEISKNIPTEDKKDE